MTENFKDHFSSNAGSYSAYRPDYPDLLFKHLAETAPGTKQAWDCATGNGQAAVKLAEYFDEVIATDASKSQLENAVPAENITYKVATAETTDLEDNSIDLITVAQALHWFDIEAFTREVERVLTKNGILAVWTYYTHDIDPAIGECIYDFYLNKVGPYWPPERKMVENAYQNITFPFRELQTPSFEMEKQWNLSHLIGYLETWSAVSAYKKEHGTNPVDTIADELSRLWGDPMSTKPVIWPLTVKIWVK